jgi:hypothetical protein
MRYPDMVEHAAELAQRHTSCLDLRQAIMHPRAVFGLVV